MLSISKHQAIESPWINMPPLRLGLIPSGLGTADLFLTISRDGCPLFRVDLYLYGYSPDPFTNAIVWRTNVFVGFADSLYVIDCSKCSAQKIELNWYFGGFYCNDDYLLASSNSELLRLGEDGQIVWRTSELGIDGVCVKSVEGGIIFGEGERDPPGGWEPFRLHLASGQRL